MRILLAFFLALTGVSAEAESELFAVTTTFEVVGSTGRIGLDGGYPTVTNEFTVHSDAVVRHFGRYVYVVNRLFADNVLVLDAGDDYSVVRQFSVSSTGLNPRDVEAMRDDKAYVSLFESNTLLVCNPLTGATLTTIDLSAFADADGTVEADQMVRVGDRVFLALQRLDRRVSPWAPTGLSTIVVIDTVTDTLIDVDADTPGVQGIALEAQNPYWDLRYDTDRQRVLTINPGAFGALDGGLEAVQPFTLESDGIVVSESALGGDLLDAALVSDTIGWALISTSTFSTCLVRFDPSRGTKTDTILCTPGFDLSDLEVSRDGRLFVGDRRAANPGVRVFDATTGAALAGPIGVGLPPFDFTLIEGVPTDAPVATPRTTLRAFPNPFNPTVTIAVDGVDDGRIEIVDARGRRVRTLELRGGRATWRGDTTDGTPAASGTYRARLVGRPQAAPIPLTLVR